MTDIRNALVLVTGATGGFGSHMVEQFHAAGSRVVISDVDQGELERFAEAFGRKGGELAGAFSADLATAGGADGLYKGCREQGLVPDIVVNNAGIALAGRLDAVPAERWERLMQINLLAPMRLCALFLPPMVERRSGHFVNISSLAGWVGSPFLAAYCASKYGLRGFSEALAPDLESHNIRVSTVFPSFSKTPILDAEQFGFERPFPGARSHAFGPGRCRAQYHCRRHERTASAFFRTALRGRCITSPVSCLRRCLCCSGVLSAVWGGQAEAGRDAYYEDQSPCSPDSLDYRLHLSAGFPPIVIFRACAGCSTGCRPGHGRRAAWTFGATVVAGVDCDWLVPRGCADAPVLYFLHGGAYVAGSSVTHRKMVSHIAVAAGMRALLPNYRLAPEARFPAGLDDCVAVYRELVAGGIEPGQMAIAGDSAGGGMAVATLLSLRDAGDALPRTACLLSPWLDLSAQGESLVTRAELDPWFRAEQMAGAVRHYCSEDQVADPLVSPVFADVSGLPATLIQVGDHEILLSDSTRLNGENVRGGHSDRVAGMAANVARVPVFYRQDAGKQAGNTGYWPLPGQAIRSGGVGVDDAPLGHRSVVRVSLAVFVHAYQKRAYRRHRFLPRHQLLLLENHGHFLDGSFAVDQRHHKCVNAGSHRLGAEGLQQWHGFLAHDDPVGQRLVSFDGWRRLYLPLCWRQR